MNQEETIKKLLKDTIGRRKKIFISSLSDLEGAEIRLPHKDAAFTAGMIKLILRRASSIKQAAAEYARIFKRESPVLIIEWTGRSFTIDDLKEQTSESFKVEPLELNVIKEQGYRKLVALKAKVKTA